MYRIIGIVIITLLLNGYATNNGNSTVKITRNKQNKLLVQAKSDAVIATKRGAEWLARDQLSGSQPPSIA